MDTWKPGTAVLRHTDKHGKSYIEEHPCWNTDLFIESQRSAAVDVGGSIAVVTHEDYIAARKASRG